MTEPEINLALALLHGLTDDEWEHALASLERAPTYAELGVISVMWSEHCSYKSSRVHLAKLPTTGPKVVQGPGENAGAVDLGDGYCAVFKMESHNHPSFIEPKQGAATGVGGILRDVFTMGARPVAALNSLRFGERDHERTKHLVRGVVEGISSYGNCMGVPTVGGELQFDASYNGNILVNAFAVGVAKTDELFFGRASGVGNLILYVGAKTGRDGIHGATMASAEFTDDAEQKRPTVQVGDPFMEKLLLECCLEVFSNGSLEGVQDMGAAGLTSSSVEMGARAKTGVELWLDAVPRRTNAMTPYELLLSESQERMLMVAKPGREGEVLAACEKWGLDFAVIGEVTDTRRFVCRATPSLDPFRGSDVDLDLARAADIVVDLPIALLTDDAPTYDRSVEPPRRDSFTSDLASAPPLRSYEDELLSLLASENIGSRAWVYRQFDHIVQGGTMVRPGAADAAVIRVLCDRDQGGPEKLLALAVDCDGRHVSLDPFQGAAMAVAECARNIVCTGGRPLGLTDCLNFGSPEVPATMWQIKTAIEGLAAACRALSVPVVSGNVSLYNETRGRAILPTPTVAIVGQVEHRDHVTTLGFKAEGHVVALLGAPGRGRLGGSEWFTRRTGRVGGDPVGIDLDAERALQVALLALCQRELLASAHDISTGGFAVAMAESMLPSGIGATITIPGRGDLAGRLFGEEPTRVILSHEERCTQSIVELCEQHGVPYEPIGVTRGDRFVVDDVFDIAVEELRIAHDSALAFMDS